MWRYIWVVVLPGMCAGAWLWCSHNHFPPVSVHPSISPRVSAVASPRSPGHPRGRRGTNNSIQKTHKNGKF